MCKYTTVVNTFFILHVLYNVNTMYKPIHFTLLCEYFLFRNMALNNLTLKIFFFSCSRYKFLYDVHDTEYWERKSLNRTCISNDNINIDIVLTWKWETPTKSITTMLYRLSPFTELWWNLRKLLMDVQKTIAINWFLYLYRARLELQNRMISLFHHIFLCYSLTYMLHT